FVCCVSRRPPAPPPLPTRRSSDLWNALASASATFDMFTLAVSGEVADTTDGTDYGFGGSVSAAVTDSVGVNLGGRWYHDATSGRSEEHTSELQSRENLVCRLLLEK